MPDIASMREDFPALWLPMTAICGRSMSICTLRKSTRSTHLSRVPQDLKNAPCVVQPVHHVKHTPDLRVHVRVGHADAVHRVGVAGELVG